ncbi:40S ribosomal protein S5-1 [Hordeum vulgare]|nr:40S ribosomal protein S5-1 [Hordeum vulgare]
MSEGMLHIRDVEGPKKTGSVETRLEAMEQQVFKCQGMVERGLNANHMMITEFTSNHKMDAIDIGKHLSRLYDRVDQLQGQIYDLQNQNCAVTASTPSTFSVVYAQELGAHELDTGGTSMSTPRSAASPPSTPPMGSPQDYANTSSASGRGTPDTEPRTLTATKEVR